MKEVRKAGGDALRQPATAAAAVAAPGAGVPGHSAAPKLLLSDQGLAAALGVGFRKCLELQNEPWAPKAVLLGPRLKRHRLEEWDQALAALPRQDRATEPAQLQRSRIEGAKQGTSGGGDAT